MALTDLTRISTSGIATGSTIDSPILRKDVDFRGDQVGVTSVLFDSSERELNIKNNAKITFGDDQALTIKHFEPGHSYIQQGAGKGDLVISTSLLRIVNAADNENLAMFSEDGAVELYNASTKRFETSGSGAVVTGILTATSFSGPTYNTSGIATFYDLRVSNNLIVEGTTTTLDTNVTSVDRLEINADSNTNSAIIGIQSGTADLVQLYDGATQVVTVDDTGNVGLGLTNPTTKLQVASGHINLSAGYSIQWDNSHERIEQSDGKLEFFTANGEKMTLSGDNLGIGSVTPSQKLDVMDGTVVVHPSSKTGIALNGISGQDVGVVRWGGDNHHAIILRGSSNADGSTITGGDSMEFREYGAYSFKTGNNSGTMAERFRISSNGSIQITPEGSTSNPYMLIDTSGDSVRFNSKKASGNNEFRFLTQSSGSVTEKLRIGTGGTITTSYQIVNDTAPDFPFVISQVDPSNTVNQLGGSGVGLIFSPATNSVAEVGAGIAAIKPGDSDGDSTSDLVFYVSQNDETLDEAVRITSDGNVIIAETMAVNRPRIVLSAPDDGTNYRHLFGANLQVDSSGTFTTPTANISGGGWEYLAQNSINQHGEIRYLSAPDTNTTSSSPLERFRIDSDGKVGIGTDDPQKQLEIHGNADTCVRIVSSAGGVASLQLGDTTDHIKGAITFKNDDNSLRIRGHNNADRIIITSGGQVRIGNENNLALWGQNNRLQVAGTSWETSGITIAKMADSTATPNLVMGSSRGSTPGTAINNGDRLGYISFVGDDGNDMHTVGAAIVAGTDAAPSSDNIPGTLQFYTGSNTSTEKLRIDSSGHMGLGVTPNANWPTNGDSKALQIGTGLAVFGRGSGDEDRGGIAVNYYTNGSNNYYIGNGNANRIYMNDGNIDFQYAGTNSSGAGAALTFGTAVRIDSGGRLLINKITNRNKYFSGTYTGLLQVESTNDSTRVTQFVQNSNNSSPHYLVIGKSRGTSVGSYDIVQNSDFLGTLSFQGADGDEMVNAASIEARVNNANGNPGHRDMPADLIFKTNQGHSAPRETLRITAKGQFLKRQQGYGNAYQDDNFGNAMVIKSGWMRFNSSFSNPTKDLVILADGGNANNNMFIKVTVVQLDYPGTDQGLGSIHIGYASAKRYGDSSGKWYVTNSTMALESGSNFHGNYTNVGSLTWENSNPSDTNTLRYTSNRYANYDMYNVQVEVWQNGNCSYYLHEDFVD